MYKIAICDDEATSLKLNRALTERILLEEDIPCEIVEFSCMDTMVAAVAKDEVSFDLLLSDILTTGITGIEAAEQLRRLGEDIPIIFISTSTDYALEGFGVNAQGYLSKPVSSDKLREALLRVYELKKKKKQLVVREAGKVCRIPYQDIQYLESRGREVRIVTDKTNHFVKGKFSDMEKNLPKTEFIKTHRSYIVNVQHLIKVERYSAMLSNYEEIPISQSLYNDTKQQFMETVSALPE